MFDDQVEIVRNVEVTYIRAWYSGACLHVAYVDWDALYEAYTTQAAMESALIISSVRLSNA